MSVGNQQKRYEEARKRKLLQGIHVGCIAQVVKFDPAAMTVDVQPLSKRLEDGKYQSQPQVLSLPVSAVKGGGFLYRPWYQTGDIGVIVYMDHDIDRVISEGREAEPNTERMHAAEDAVFLGGIVPWSQPVGGLPAEAAILSTDDSKIWFALKKDGIEIHGKVEVYDGDLIVYGHDVKADSVSLKSHLHGQVESGSDVSGKPIGG